MYLYENLGLKKIYLLSEFEKKNEINCADIVGVLTANRGKGFFGSIFLEEFSNEHLKVFLNTIVLIYSGQKYNKLRQVKPGECQGAAVRRRRDAKAISDGTTWFSNFYKLFTNSGGWNNV